MLLFASTAATMNYDVLCFDYAETGHLVRQGHAIKGGPVKVTDQSTLLAEKVVMLDFPGFKATLVITGINPLNQLHILKGGQGPVHRVQAQGRQMIFQPAVQGFGRGMVGGRQQGPIDLQPLVGDFETGLPAELPEVFKIAFTGSHRRVPLVKINSYLLIVIK
jgi:hypothetical protein